MTELEIHLLGVDQAMMQPLVVLREKSGDHRLLPIWIGAAEALAIARPSENGADPDLPRPLTYELLARVIAALGHQVVRIRICGVLEGVFFAEIRFDSGVCVSCRASDAVALAVNLDLPICAAEEVLAEAALPDGTVVAADLEDEPTEDEPVSEETELQRFREFLDAVKPEDFSMMQGETGPGRSIEVPPEQERIRKRVVVGGTVQGVFFRDSCQDVARRYEVAGWVTNRGDGSVEAVFEGAPDDVNTLVEWAAVGPAQAEVRTVQVVEELPEGLDGFSVRRG